MINSRPPAIFLFLLFVFSPVLLSAQQSEPMSAEKLWQLKRVGSLVLSPDGRTAAVVVTSYDIDKNKGHGNIWLISLASGEAQQFTTGPSTESAPQWSPDGRTIAFTAKRNEDERAQLYLIPVGGGEARRVTEMPLGVTAVKWFPDGESLAFASSTLARDNGNLDSLKAELKRRKDDKVNAKISEDRVFRYWDRYLTDGWVQHIYRYDVASEEVTDLTPDMDRRFHYTGGVEYDISPDGEEIAVTMIVSGPPYDTLYTDIYALATDGNGAMRNLTPDNPASDFGPHYTHGGKYLLFGRNLRMDMNGENTKLTRLDRATGERTELCRYFDRSPAGWVSDEREQTVYFIADHLGKKSVFSVPMSGGAVTTLLHQGSNSGLQVADGRIIFLHQHLSAPPAVYVMDTDGGNLRQVSSFNEEVLAGIAMGRVENVWYEGAGQDSVQMYVIYPPDFDAKKKWPLLVMIHGGPHGTFGDDFHPRWNAQVFAAGGYVTVAPNFHGSTGFGEYFADRINREHPRLPFIDVMKATDEMEKRPYIDASRTAAAGGSYGGYLVTWIGGHTDRYACLINHAGVYNLMAQFGSDVTFHRDISYGGLPWDGRDQVLRWSPSQYAADYVTPTLVIHGEKDYRVPYGQGLEAYGMLKAKGVPSRIIIYPTENHWILTPQNSIHWYGEFHAWLERWIGKGGR
ncbi:MAG: S9 family peptidase [Bacteroidetes bacterium]|nr:S9 family peptidase [Bacteroidota bacterium]